MNKELYIFLFIFACLIFTACQKNEIPSKEPPSDWFFKQRAFPYQDVDTKIYLSSLQQKQESLKNRNTPSAFDQPWKFLGPTNIGGRITDIEMWPNDINTILAGSASGGIFKSIDQGISWKPIFDDAASLSIGDMTVSKSNPDVIYVGTGEANGGGGSMSYDGIGVYRSNDRGDSWDHVGLEGVGSIGKVVVNPNNEQEVYVAAMGRLFGFNEERGVYKTIDGGQNWNHILSVTDSTGAIDLAIHQDNPDTLFAAMWERSRRPNDIIYGGKTSGIYRSFNGGEDWELLENGLPSQEEEMGRIGLAIAPSNQNKIYAFIAKKIGFIQGVYVSEDLGDSWSELPIEGIMDVPFQWWFGKIFVDPINEDEIFLASFNMHKHKVGESTWQEFFPGVHIDQHALYVHPQDPNFVVNGNDGGIYISYDKGETYFKSENLPNVQFYTCEIDPSNPNIVFGGAQDRGTYRNQSDETDTWENVLGGDGFRIVVDMDDPNLFYCEFQNGGAWRTRDGGITFESIIATIDPADRNNWNTPLTRSYQGPERIYYGTQRVWESFDQGDTFVPISEDLSNGPYEGNRAFGTITSIESSRANSDILYAGTDDGNVWNSLDAGTTWNKLDLAMNVNRWTTSVLPDPGDQKVAYVSFSGFRYDSNDGSVYKTKDEGQTWIDITGDLPDIPINDIQIDLRDNEVVYLATDIGVYYSNDEGNHWEILGEGLPNVPIMDIDFELSGDDQNELVGKLVAATYGRSMYYYELPILVSNENQLVINIKVYPNPNAEYLTVETEESLSDDFAVTIVSLQGIEVWSEYDLSSPIPIGHLPKGIYFLSIKNKKGQILTTEKIFKI